MQQLRKPLSLFVLSALISACSGGSSSSSTPSPETPDTDPDAVTLSGKVLAPDNDTPLSGATVYIPAAPQASKNSITTTKSLAGASISNPETQSQGVFFASEALTQCNAPTQDYLIYTCTNPDGTFSLSLTTESESIDLSIEKGVFNFTSNTDVDADTKEVDFGDLPIPKVI